MSCSICEKRQEKRFCPAVHSRICPQCCGEQREVTLDCPSDCVYLQQARQHEKPRSIEEVDKAALFPAVEIPDHFLYDHEHLVLGLSFALAKAAQKDRSLHDTDVIAALDSIARSYETLVNSGLHYGAAMTNFSQQAVVQELQLMVKEYREAEEKHLGYSRLRDSEVLQALVFLLRMGYVRTSGRPLSRAYLDLLRGQFPADQSAVSSAQDSASRLIVP